VRGAAGEAATSNADDDADGATRSRGVVEVGEVFSMKRSQSLER